jgi:predicted O-linked N-acetylglucosamine transferase (SPINDLY family)
MTLNRPAAAEQAYLQVLQRRPDDAAAITDLAAIMLQRNKLDQAIDYGRRAVLLDPKSERAHLRLGRALQQQGKIDEAVAVFQQASAIATGPDARLSLGLIWSDEGRATEATQAFADACMLRPNDAALHSLLIGALELDPDSTPYQRAVARRTWAERIADPLTRAASPSRLAPSPRRRLRVGYVGADTFRVHSGAMVLLPVVEGHDPRTVEVYCYSDTPREWDDDVTARFRRAAVYRETRAVSDQGLAERIREDGIDVLVDTYGHPPGSRLLALACQPAPVQICFPVMGSFSMAAVGYAIGSRVLTPRAGLAEFQERVIRLPISYQYDPLHELPPVDPTSPFERTGRITFGCFGRLSRLNDRVLTAWREILERAPGSQLLLRLRPEDHVSRFMRRLDELGLSRDRVNLLGWVENNTAYLADHNLVDMALDTFPYGGVTTSCDALSMGVPLVTVTADRVLGRYSADFLNAVDAPELVAATPAEYVAAAVALAKDHDRRLTLRRTLSMRFKASRLSDGRRLARDLERVYRLAWNRCAAHGKTR